MEIDHSFSFVPADACAAHRWELKAKFDVYFSGQRMRKYFCCYPWGSFRLQLPGCLLETFLHT